MYYLKAFETTEEYNKNGGLLVPSISLTEDDDLLHFDTLPIVDLGLSSGTKWANMNIGAKSETDYGLYFQWGDTVGYTGDKALAHSTWSTCPGNGGNSFYNITSLTAWNNEHLTNNILNTDVDAAYIHSNGRMKMPTAAQCQELLNETNHSWVTNYNGTGINGIKFVSKKDTSKYIFIPSSGHASDGSFYNVSLKSRLWSSSVYTSNAQCAYYLGHSSDYYGVGGNYRSYGQCVRGIVNV